MEAQTSTEQFKDQIILWQDFSEPSQFYRSCLVMRVHEDGKRSLELRSGGSVCVLPYTFGYSKEDKL